MKNEKLQEKKTKIRIIREIILESLFQLNFSDKNYEEIVENIEHISLSRRILNENDKSNVYMYLENIIKKRNEIDNIIKKYSKNWDFKRIGNVEKTVLRLAVYELKEKKNIPHKVVINEAIELCKKYSEEDSGKFVNGILHNIVEDIKKENNNNNFEDETNE